MWKWGLVEPAEDFMMNSLAPPWGSHTDSLGIRVQIDYDAGGSYFFLFFSSGSSWRERVCCVGGQRFGSYLPKRTRLYSYSRFWPVGFLAVSSSIQWEFLSQYASKARLDHLRYKCFERMCICLGWGLESIAAQLCIIPFFNDFDILFKLRRMKC